MTSLQIVERNEDEIPVKTSEILCQICQKQFSNYLCPRCNLRYCSLACYRDGQHADCAESFYKDSVLAEIDSKVDPAQRNQMIETLRRFEAENEASSLILTDRDGDDDDDEEEEEEDIAQRLAHLDIETADAEALWARLTPTERREFEELIRNRSASDIDHLLEYGGPWWTIPVAKISALDDEDENGNTVPELPDTDQISAAILFSKKRPHPDLLYHWLSILMSYCYIVRQWMGSIRDDIPATIQCLQEQSILFAPTQIQFSSIEDVLIDIMTRSAADHNANDRDMTETVALLLDDITILLSTSDYTLRAMADLERLLKEARIRGMKKQLFIAEKKAAYFVAFTAYLMEHTPIRKKIELETIVERDRIRMEKTVIRTTERAACMAMNQQQQSQPSPKITIEQTKDA
ncbi:hypothetical protein BX666DRAFT_1998846 [Dichotomocladium elegans]|nr:hypothetical protein BX666DRAFT_1998846 [Dichotomocladium elegans]